MIYLLDLGPSTLHAAESELEGIECGQLLTPLTRYSDQNRKYGIDNGAFSSFNERGFISLLERQSAAKERCLFVAVPDVVGSAVRTSEVFARWAPRLGGWPLAYVAQDGVEGVDIPWDAIKAVFIGGTDSFKLGPNAEHVVKAAKILGKWVHVGRVNTRERFERFSALGADSCDGSGICRFSHMRKELAGRGLYE